MAHVCTFILFPSGHGHEPVDYEAALDTQYRIRVSRDTAIEWMWRVKTWEVSVVANGTVEVTHEFRPGEARTYTATLADFTARQQFRALCRRPDASLELCSTEKDLLLYAGLTPYGPQIVTGGATISAGNGLIKSGGANLELFGPTASRVVAPGVDDFYPGITLLGLQNLDWHDESVEAGEEDYGIPAPEQHIGFDLVIGQLELLGGYHPTPGVTGTALFDGVPPDAGWTNVQLTTNDNTFLESAALTVSITVVTAEYWLYAD